MSLTNEDLMAISNLMDQKIHPINGRLDRMENKLDHMENRMDKLESDISAIKVGQADLRKHLKEVDQKVSDTYQLALNAWGTSTENRNWLENNKLNA